MKNAITLVAIAIFISLFFIQQKSLFASEKPIVKNINLEVYKSNDYLSAVYNDATAKISITITKVSHRSRIIVYNKGFDALQLKQYPVLEDALLQKVAINNVFDNKEHLEVRCTISYNSNGGLLEIHHGALVSKGITGSTLIIQI
ncbi:MAG: hypothetical protein ABI921_10610 [Panacibacter sp.]